MKISCQENQQNESLILSEKHIYRIFLRFSEIYQSAFYNTFPEENYPALVKEWMRELKNTNLFDIPVAIQICRENGSKFPPTAKEFRMICGLNGIIPSNDDAFNLAVRKEFSHPVIKLAYDKISSWDWSHDQDRILRMKWKSAYQSAIINFQNGTLPKNIEPNISHDDYNSIKQDDNPVKSIKDIALNIKENVRNIANNNMRNPRPIKCTERPDNHIPRMIALGAEIAKILKRTNPELSWPEIDYLLINRKKQARKLDSSWDEMQVLKVLLEEVIQEEKEFNKREVNEY